MRSAHWTVFLLLLGILDSLTGCSPAARYESASVAEVRSDDTIDSCQEYEGPINKGAGPRISFENVGFAVDKEWLKDVSYFVKPECILTRDDIKPDPIGGRSLVFDLRYRDLTDRAAHVVVVKVEDYRKAFAHYPQYLENRDEDLKALIASDSPLPSYGSKAPSHFRWMDAEELFYAKAARIDFIGGSGIFTVTQISQGLTSVNNDSLQYLFQGFTADGTYFVEMSFPTKLRGLPDDVEVTAPQNGEEYRKYTLKTAAAINAAKPSDFRPSFDEVRRFINRFEIK